jgi:predicted nucleic acid-binding protein
MVPQLLRESTTERVEILLRRDPQVVLWWGTPVECISALARLHRQGSLPNTALRRSQNLLEQIRERAYEVQPVEEIRARAERLLLTHRLRAADALQLAAALAWCRDEPRGIGFISLDDRLRGAAATEGFSVMPYADEVHDEELLD